MFPSMLNEKLAGFAAPQIDKLLETTGLDFLDIIIIGY
jgi:hypothetical protein